jgi:hypothetical protein
VELPKIGHSEVHVLDRLEVIDLRTLVFERGPRRQQLEERAPRQRLHDQPIPFFAENGPFARKLKVPRYPDRLIASIP